jgi:hypothetical protein
MNWDHLQFLDLRRADTDPDVFAAALAVHYVRRLLTSGGSVFAHPEDAGAAHPQHLAPFLARAVEMAKKAHRFEHEWLRLQRVMPRIQLAWEEGQALFQQDLARATANQEEMEYLSMIDFAVDCYAYVAARKSHPDDRTLQNWVINGYMLAWRGHFLKDLEGEDLPEQRL